MALQRVQDPVSGSTTPTNMLNRLQRPVREEEVRFFRENGFVCLRKVISEEAVQLLRASLEDAFGREDSSGYGARTDMTAAAKALADEGKNVLFDDSVPHSSRPTNMSGRYLTEIECGRWNKGVRKFEHEGYVVVIYVIFSRIKN